MTHQLRFANCNCDSPTAIHQLRFANSDSATAIHQLRFGNCDSPTAIRQLPFANCDSPIAIRQLRIANDIVDSPLTSKTNGFPDSRLDSPYIQTLVHSEPAYSAISPTMRDVAIFLTYNVPGSMPCTIIYSE